MRLLLSLLAILIPASLLAQSTNAQRAVQVYQGTAVVAYPTNLWASNAPSIYDALTNAGYTFGGSGGVTDGNKGDITVSGSGATWSLNATATALVNVSNALNSTIGGLSSVYYPISSNPEGYVDSDYVATAVEGLQSTNGPYIFWDSSSGSSLTVSLYGGSIWRFQGSGSGTGFWDFNTDTGALHSDGGFVGNLTGNASTATTAGSATTATTATTANSGDSATAFFSTGTIEHERGGLEANVSGYGGLVGISGGATLDVNTIAEFDTALGLTGTPSATTYLDGSGAWSTPAGAGAGPASSATNVVTVDSTDATSFVAILDSATGTQQVKTDAGMTYDASTGTLTVTGLNVTDAASYDSMSVTDFEMENLIGEIHGTTNVAAGSIGAASMAANAVALGSGTTGNYVATIADSGASEVTVSGSGSETAAVTLAIASTIARDSEVTAAITAAATNLQANAFSHATKTVTTAPTNLVLSLTNTVYSSITATNNINLTFSDIVPGAAATLKVLANGADRVLTWPTNATLLSTNGIVTAGALHFITVTNGRTALLSIAAFSGGDLTNAVIGAQLCDR